VPSGRCGGGFRRFKIGGRDLSTCKNHHLRVRFTKLTADSPVSGITRNPWNRRSDPAADRAAVLRLSVAAGCGPLAIWPPMGSVRSASRPRSVAWSVSSRPFGPGPKVARLFAAVVGGRWAHTGPIAAHGLPTQHSFLENGCGPHDFCREWPPSLPVPARVLRCDKRAKARRDQESAASVDFRLCRGWRLTSARHFQSAVQALGSLGADNRPPIAFIFEPDMLEADPENRSPIPRQAGGPVFRPRRRCADGLRQRLTRQVLYGAFQSPPYKNIEYSVKTPAWLSLVVFFFLSADRYRISRPSPSFGRSGLLEFGTAAARGSSSESHR